MAKLFSSDVPWFQFRPGKTQPRLRLFCFPYAGGGASIFRGYSTSLPESVEVVPVQLPGRENRLAEKPFTNLTDLIDVLMQVLRPYLNIPYAFFGHSMGALVSFELTRALRRQNDTPGPLHLFVSGRRAPQLLDPDPPTYDLPEPLFLERLRELGGTPEEVLAHAELLQMIVPLLRADFALCETYQYRQEPPLDCSVSAFGGLQDKEVSSASIEEWKEQTTVSFKRRFFVGDHFFLLRQERQLLAILTQELLAYLR